MQKRRGNECGSAVALLSNVHRSWASHSTCWLGVLPYKHEDCHWDPAPRQKLGIVLHTCDATVEDNQWNFLASSQPRERERQEEGRKRRGCLQSLCLKGTK